VREVAEEVGLVARIRELVGVFAREAGTHGNPHSVVSVVYLCEAIGGDLRPQPHEVREIAWRSIDDVDNWHHHHESLARAALETHWRRAVGG
jgi:ADP-ribose pyrophosphatase YjhB (NUDIX family)